MENLQALRNYLDYNIEKTKRELKDCDRFNYPSNESLKENLQFRLEWLETQLDNLNYPIEYKK